MSAIKRSADCHSGDDAYFFHCQRQIEDAYTLRGAMYWHEQIINELELEILTAYAFPRNDFEAVIDVLQNCQERYESALGRLKVAFLKQSR